jgi:hypothetical protein
MKCKPWLIVVLLACFTQAGAAAPVALGQPDLTASGQAYDRVIRLRGIERDVTYFDPMAPPPSLKTGRAPGQTGGPSGGLADRTRVLEGLDFVTLDGVRITLFILAAVMLFGITYIFIAHGGRLPVSFARDIRDETSLRRGGVSEAQGHGSAPLRVDAILRMKDRKLALVALCKSLLARAVAAEGVLLQDSWTDRDALRHVPQNLQQHEALQQLVFASERVQFGGRDVTEEEFSNHVSRLETLWTKGFP